MSPVRHPLCPAQPSGHSAHSALTIHDFIMATPGIKSGKFAGIVYQRARYGQIFYPAFIPANPRTPAQQAVRGAFGMVSKRWRTLTQDQRDLWKALAPAIKSRRRLTNGPLTGFHLFVKINVARVHRGLPLAELPPADPRLPQLTGIGPFYTSRFDQPPLGPTLFLQANHLLADWHGLRRKFVAGVAPPT